MEKNTIIAIVLSVIVIVAGFTVQSIFFPAQAPSSFNTVDADNSVQAVNSTPSALSILEETTFEKITATPDVISEKTFTITTNVFEITFTNKGGDITSIKLLNHKDGDKYVEMADGITSKERAFSLFLGNENDYQIDDIFSVKQIDDYTIGFFKTFTKKNTLGESCSFTLVKKYAFKPDNYMFEFSVTIDGDDKFDGLSFNNNAYTIGTSPRIGPEFDEKNKYEYRAFYTYINGKDKKITLSPGKKEQKSDRMTWTAVGGKYFAIAAVPDNLFLNVTFSTLNNVEGKSQSRMFITRPAFRDNRMTDTFKFYVGPKTENILKTYNTADNNPYGLMSLQLNEIVDTSSLLGWLETLLKLVMQLFYKLIPNWGIAIIIMTILVKVMFFPLTKKSSIASKKMQELQPAIAELQEKYKDKPEKLKQEMAALYQKTGSNPVSGCLPLIIQFPILIAMYNLFNSHFELRGAMFIPGWIPDLSQGDSLLKLPFALPFLGWTDLRLLPILYTISQLIYGKITQTPSATQSNSSMKFMMFGMPLIFFFMFYNAPAGLLLYWSCSNLLQMVQQFVINRTLGNVAPVSVTPVSKKTGKKR